MIFECDIARLGNILKPEIYFAKIVKIDEIFEKNQFFERFYFTLLFFCPFLFIEGVKAIDSKDGFICIVINTLFKS